MLDLLFALQLNLLLGVIAKLLRVVDLTGMAAGVLLGTAVWQRAGLGGWAPFAAFVVCGAVAARWPVHASGRGQSARDARTAVHALGYCLVPTVLAAMWQAFPDPSLCRTAVAAGFAGALAVVVTADVLLPTAGGNARAGVGEFLFALMRGLIAGGVIALAGHAAGAIGFWQIWIVVAAAVVALACAAAGGMLFGGIARVLIVQGDRRYAEGATAFVSTLAASLVAFALAHASRS